VFSFSSWVTVLLPWQCRGSSATSPTLTMAPHSWEQLGALKKTVTFLSFTPFSPTASRHSFSRLVGLPEVPARRRRREQARPGLWRDATGEATPCTRLSALCPSFSFFEKREEAIHIMFASFARLPLVTHPRPPAAANAPFNTLRQV